MTFVDLLAILAGAAIVFANLLDVFVSVVLPRAAPSRRRLSSLIVRQLWRFWKQVAHRMTDTVRRENFLGSFAPIALVTLLVVWATGCIVGFGFIEYGLRQQIKPVPGIGEALYFAGTSFFTIGYGDVVAVGGAARIVGLMAGASGFAIVAIVTAFLFSVVGGFQTRERFVVTFGTRAGRPPSGVTLLETYALGGMSAQLDDLFEQGLDWAASVLESHTAYPILTYFRSSHDDESWIATAGALLDASTLQLSLVTGAPRGRALLFQKLGRQLVDDLSRFFELPNDRAPGVERHEFDLVRVRLQEAGLAVEEPDEAWDRFSALRGSYATPLNAMARYWRIPPAQWVGDRSIVRRVLDVERRREAGRSGAAAAERSR